MLLVEPGRPQHVLLALARGAVDLGAQVLGELGRGHADTARGGVDQDRLAGFQPAQITQRVVRRQEHQRHRGRLLIRPVRGLTRDHRPFGDGQRARATGDQAHHLVARRQVGHLGADFDDDSGELADQQPGFALVHAEDVQHVPEVQARRPDGDADTGRAERFPCHRFQGEMVDRAPAGHAQPPVAGRRDQAARRLGGDQARHQQFRATQGKLRLVAGQDGVVDVDRVDQDEPVRVLGLGAAHQAPDGRQDRIRRTVVRSGRDRSGGLDDQFRRVEPLFGQPGLEHGERVREHGVYVVAARSVDDNGRHVRTQVVP
ncbi:hypothetical protein KIPE111705_43960 [Kibdelosporangium persicum]